MKHLLSIVGIISLLAPTLVDAEHYRYRLYNNDGGDVTDSDIREWRERSSRTSSKIQDLDNDIVDDLPVPVLFGAPLSTITDNFGDPRGGGARTHEGLDILAPEGTPIVSPTDAVVIRVSEGQNSGLYVTTANPGGESFIYMHLSEIADIEAGDELDAGDLIGLVGDTGNALGGPAHLHWEIRESRTPKNPFDRLDREFSLEEKMEFVGNFLGDVRDEDEFADFLANEYVNVFIQAQAEGIDIPEEIEDRLPVQVTTTDSSLTRDLSLGSQGLDVLVLQSKLISYGFLALTTPTQYFGPLTQSALIAYQESRGISPASGYFGPITRSYMLGDTVTVTDADDIEKIKAELMERIKELQEILEKLLEEQA